MTEAYIKKLDDIDLIDELNNTKDILDLCVSGVLNERLQADPVGLLSVKDNLFFLTEELQKRFMDKDRGVK